VLIARQFRPVLADAEDTLGTVVHLAADAAFQHALVGRVLDKGLAGDEIRRCTCSYCRMRGAVVAMADMGWIRILEGEETLTTYRFHSGAAQHFFCLRCGIYTNRQRRSDQSLYAVNVACLDGTSPFDFSEVPVMDGINHTSDTGKPTRRAGILRFIPAS
jgi:hypothetical protein